MSFSPPLTDAAGTVPLGTAQQRTWVVALRVVVALSVLVGWALLARSPVERTVEDLLAALERGEVTEVTLDRPEPEAEGWGRYPVRWEGPGRPGRAFYEYVSSPDTPPADEGATILRAAAAAGVDAEVVAHHPVGGLTVHVEGIGSVVVLVLLVAGTAPRLATRWAWFWLWLALPPAALAYVLLEPVPLWRRESAPAARRLTGGWALLLALVAPGVLGWAVPGYADLFA